MQYNIKTQHWGYIHMIKVSLVVLFSLSLVGCKTMNGDGKSSSAKSQQTAEATVFEGTLSNQPHEEGGKSFQFQTDDETYFVAIGNPEVKNQLFKMEQLTHLRVKGIVSEDRETLTIQEVDEGEVFQGTFTTKTVDIQGMDGIKYTLKTSSKTYVLEMSSPNLNEKFAELPEATKIVVKGYPSKDDQSIMTLEFNELN
jgi:hypothetical protein